VTLILPFVAVLLFLSLSPATAGAQALQVPRVEVGGQVGWIGAIGECLCVLPIVGPRLTVNISQQNAVELSVETLTPGAPRAYGLYFLQFKRTPRRPSNWSGITPFYTVEPAGTTTTTECPSIGRSGRTAPSSSTPRIRQEN
jgi:hypothetical protein